MQRIEVIGFEKRIDRQLPIDPPLQNPRFVVMEGSETICREVGCKAVQQAIDIECSPRRSADPDHPVFLDDRHGTQPAHCPVDCCKGALVWTCY